METELKESSEQETQTEAVVEEKVTEKVEEPMVPLHEHTALRSRAQTAEVDNARLKGQIDILTAQQTTEAPVNVSPVDREIARQREEDPDLTDDDIVITAKTFRDQEAWKVQTANQASEDAAASDLKVQQAISVQTAYKVHDDYMDVINQGDKLLTEGQLLDCRNAGADFGEKSYQMCKSAIEKANLKAAPESSEQTDDEKVAADAAAKVKADAEAEKAVPSQESILSNISLQTTRVQNL
jgi:hypothetical protein